MKKRTLTVCLVVAWYACAVTHAIAWLSLHKVDPSVDWRHRRQCREARHEHGLTRTQTRLCKTQVGVMRQVSAAAGTAVRTCAHVFRSSRWNCSSLTRPKPSNDISTGTREQAVVEALSSASLVWTVARACSAGEVLQCGCALAPSDPPNGHFAWGGCGDNLHFADNFAAHFIGKKRKRAKKKGASRAAASSGHHNRSQQYHINRRSYRDTNFWLQEHRKRRRQKMQVDEGKKKKERKKKKKLKHKKNRELAKTRRRTLELVRNHNNMVGRKVVQSSLQTSCKCHGVSGSCTIKTCWKALTSFAKIGDRLRQRYSFGVEVRGMRVAARLRLVPAAAVVARFSTDDLVYIARSPDYCRPDPERGSYGTHGRKCNASSYDEDGCELMCCGRGHTSQLQQVQQRCNCRYHWCCYVTCDTCTTWQTLHTCH